jgi:polar amino acid transport system substrate-binding protein
MTRTPSTLPLEEIDVKIRVLLAIAASLLISTAWARQTLVLNSTYYAPVTSEKRDGVLDQVYKELSRRLGIKIEIHTLAAAERVLLNVNEGVVDGDVGRVQGLEKRYPNMVMVPVPVMKYEMVVFSRNADFKVVSPDSIKPHDVGLVRGWKILEQASVGARSVTTLENAEQMFTMLDKNRIDIALLEKLQGLHMIRRMGIKNIKVLQPNLLEGNWYLYLNKKHEALIPRMTEELTRMEQEGLLQRIHDSVLARYTR